MAISPMKYVTIIAVKQSLDSVLQSVQHLRQVHVKDLSTEEDWYEVFDNESGSNNSLISQYDEVEKVHLTDEEALQFLNQRIKRIEDAIYQYEHYLPAKKLWEKLRTPLPSLSFKEIEQQGRAFDEHEVVEYARRSVERLNEIDTQEELLKAKHDSLNKWRNLEVTPTQLEGFKYVNSLIGTIPNTQDDEYINEIKRHPDFVYDVVYLNDYEYGLVVFSALPVEKMRTTLQEFGFQPFEYEETVLPRVKLEAYEQELDALKQERQSIIQSMRSKQNELENLKVQYEYVSNLASRERVKRYIGDTQNLVAIEGWIEEEKAESFQQQLIQQFGHEIVIRIDQIEEKDYDEVPVKLKNNRLFEPFEQITSMFALPKYGHFDPTPYMMPFYAVFFGMMVADAGYGLLLILGTWLGLKLFQLAPSMRLNFRLFHAFGWTTLLWGLIYGSFFGLSLPFKLLDVTEDALVVIAISIVLGAIQMVLGFILNIKEQLIEKDPYTAYTDGLAWILVFAGLVLFLVGKFVPGMAVLMPIGKWLALINVIGIVIISIVKARGPVGLATGLYNLFGASGYIGDFVSYTRLMALGLSGASIGSAFNMIVNMFPVPLKFTIGVVLFIFIHLFNLFLSSLSGYVHGLRLIFVEFFGKFFEGGGKPFEPLGAKEKYVVIKEEKMGDY